MPDSGKPVRIAIITGEPSGDLLAGELAMALRERLPDLQIAGVAGPALRGAGCEVLAPMEQLSVMGLTEVLGALPRLLLLRRRLVRDLLARRPHLVIGVDAPDFNLGLESMLSRQGISCMHYVSPAVWAWRSGRVAKVAHACDDLLTLFPFEARCYARTPLRTHFVGHPLARRIRPGADPVAARRQLGVDPRGTLIALLPGSRRSEYERLWPAFADAARCLSANDDLLPRNGGPPHFMVPAANPEAASWLGREVRRQGLPATVVEGDTVPVLTAANGVLVASGTATLETLLVGRPMVVAYKVSAASAVMLRRRIQAPHVALPNILAGEALVPELLQEKATGESLASALIQEMSPARAAHLRTRFSELADSLKASTDAATVVCQRLAAMGVV